MLAAFYVRASPAGSFPWSLVILLLEVVSGQAADHPGWARSMQSWPGARGLPAWTAPRRGPSAARAWCGRVLGTIPLQDGSSEGAALTEAQHKPCQQRKASEHGSLSDVNRSFLVLPRRRQAPQLDRGDPHNDRSGRPDD